MDIEKLLLVFYCTILYAAEKKAHPLGRVSYAATARLAINRNNGAGPAGDDREMREFRENERRAQEMAARRAIRQDEMEADDTQEDDWDEEDVAPVKVAKHKHRDIKLPSHFITAEGKWYKIPEKQWEQYSRGQITWEDVMDWIRAFAAAKR